MRERERDVFKGYRIMERYLGVEEQWEFSWQKRVQTV
jgi:hypothetical protein